MNERRIVPVAGARGGSTLRQDRIDGARARIQAEHALREVQAMAAALIAFEGVLKLPDAEALELARGIADRSISVTLGHPVPAPGMVRVGLKRDGALIRYVDVERPE